MTREGWLASACPPPCSWIPLLPASGPGDWACDPQRLRTPCDTTNVPDAQAAEWEAACFGSWAPLWSLKGRALGPAVLTGGPRRLHPSCLSTLAIWDPTHPALPHQCPWQLQWEPSLCSYRFPWTRGIYGKPARPMVMFCTRSRFPSSFHQR